MRSAGEEIVTIGPEAQPARWSWTPGAAGVVFVIQAGRSLGPSGIAVVSGLRERNLSWLRLPLLAPRQRPWRGDRQHIALYGDRVLHALDWVRSQPHAARAAVGLFGERQGAGLSMWLAAHRPEAFAAVVTFHGRLDLSVEEAGHVDAASLMMVAELDPLMVSHTRQQVGLLPGAARLELIRGTTRSLKRPGARDEVAHLAAAWFEARLSVATRRGQAA